MGERIRCRKCGDILQSKYRHDFQMCKCGSCYIDGGDDYCRVKEKKENIEWIDRNDGKQFKYLFDYCEEIINKKIMSNWYTRGRLDRKTWKLEDQENEFLYSEGKYITKIKEIDLPKDYIKIRNRTIWYLTGYLRTSGVKDLYYTYIKENHLFKDDYLYISYDKKIEGIKGKYSNDEVRNFDFFICGGDIIKVLYAIEKNSDIDTTEIRNKIKEKFEWWKENEQEDYKRSFGGKKIDDIFEYYEKNIK